MVKKTTYNFLVDYFIGLSNETGNLISNLKLQKLLYYAQAWHLAYFGDRLIEGDFQAWVHGPVLPEAYREYRNFGWRPIEREDLDQRYIDNFCDKIVSKEQCELLVDIVDEYFGLSGFELERLTHSEDPWKMARADLPMDAPSENVITDQSMIDYYQQFVVNG